MAERAQANKDSDAYMLRAYLNNRLDACNGKLHPRDYAEVQAFDAAAAPSRRFSPLNFDGIVFYRVRHGTGFLVQVDPGSIQFLFAGGVVLTGSADEAAAFARTSPAPVCVFEAINQPRWSDVSPIFSQPAYSDEDHRDRADRLFAPVGDRTPAPCILHEHDTGRDVAVFGRMSQRVVLDLDCRIIGWSPADVFEAVFDGAAFERFQPPNDPFPDRASARSPDDDGDIPF